MPVFKHKKTGAVAIASTLEPSSDFQLTEIRLHLSAAGGAVGDVNLVISVDSADGPAYDIVLATQDMTAVTDYLYQPSRPLTFSKGDKIIFTYANGSSKTYGLLALYEPLSIF